ncbi:MAG: hypothetical protein RPR91_05270 [Colwellia sp.]
MNLLNDQHDAYGLSQLIFINSGSNAYTRLPLDESLAITMSNNGGKSANLRALKLLLLPEVNFLDGKKKFAFQAADGTTYSDEDSYKFYFPSSSSFIVGEIFNPHRGGTKYCQVLMRSPSSKLGYQRWFIPVSYEELEPLFFDTTSTDNKGLGKPTYIDEKTASTRFREMKGRLVTKKNEIKKLLFSTYNPGQPDSFFSLFPMAEEPTDEHIEAFKSLIHLAFNMKAGDGSSTAKAVSTILSRIVSDDAKFKVDIGKIPEEAHELFLEKVKLDKMVNLESKWDETDKLWVQSKHAIDRAKNSYANLKASYDEHAENFQGIIDKANDEHELCLRNFGDRKSQLNKVNDSIKIIEGIIKSKNKESNILTMKMNEAVALRKVYRAVNCHTDRDIADHIQEDEYQGIDALTKMISTLEDRSKIESELQSEFSKRKDYDYKIFELKQLIQDTDKNITSRLSVAGASILTTLMPDLKTAVVELSDSEAQTIEAFIDLFHVNPDSKNLYFLNNNLPKLNYASYDKINIVNESKFVLEKERRNLKHCIDKQGELNDALKEYNSDNTDSIEKYRSDLKEAIDEKKIISSAETNIETLKDVKRALLEGQVEASEHEAKREAIKQHHDRAQVCLDKAKREREEAYSIRNRLKNTENMLMQPHRDLHRIVGQNPDSFPTPNDVEIIDGPSMLSVINSLNIEIDNISVNSTEITKLIDKIVQSKCIDLSEYLPDGLIGMSLIMLDPALRALASEFSTLVNHLENHSRRVIAHNHETSSQVTVIRDIIRQVSNFESELNDELAGIRVSDLSEIKIEIVKKKLFTELAHDLERQITNFDQEVLQSDAFYGRIQEFCNQVLIGTSGNISMEQIVESVRWHIKKNGQVEKASQSTGTQGLLNATLMMLLLKSMMQDHVSVKIPIIFDEIGSLDSSNFRTLREAAESRGFILLVASPETTGQIISELPAINLGLWELENIPKNLAKCCVVYNKAAERMTAREIEEAEIE